MVGPIQRPRRAASTTRSFRRSGLARAGSRRDGLLAMQSNAPMANFFAFSRRLSGRETVSFGRADLRMFWRASFLRSRGTSSGIFFSPLISFQESHEDIVSLFVPLQWRFKLRPICFGSCILSQNPRTLREPCLLKHALQSVHEGSGSSVPLLVLGWHWWDFRHWRFPGSWSGPCAWRSGRAPVSGAWRRAS